MQWKPNKHIALLLGLVTPFLAMLYVTKYKWALFYLVITLNITAAEMYFSAPWLQVVSLSVVVVLLSAIHAYRIAARADVVSFRPGYSKWYGLVAVYVSVVAFALLFRSFLYEPFRMPSGSMLPTIQVGSYMLVQKYGYAHYDTFGVMVAHSEMTAPINRGDMVVFDSPDDSAVKFIKRVIGLPGDRVVYRENRLEINGSPVPTNYVGNQVFKQGGKDYEYEVWQEQLQATSYQTASMAISQVSDFMTTVPESSYFVLGDNRNNSRDSRHFGFIQQESVVGKVVLVSR